MSATLKAQNTACDSAPRARSNAMEAITVSVLARLPRMTVTRTTSAPTVMGRKMLANDET